MAEPAEHAPRILIVDDEQANVRVLTRFLASEGYHDVLATTDSRLAFPLFDTESPDLVLLDLHMPHLSGMAVLEAIRNTASRDSYVPVLVLTADPTPEAKKQALALGAHDFLTKPFDFFEARCRIRNLLHARRLHVQLSARADDLDAKVRARTAELERTHLDMLERLTTLAAYRDEDTGQHTRRVADVAAAIARRLGLPPDEVDLIRRAAPLHDLGKVAVSDAILRKPGRLTAEEMEEIRTHTTVGAAVLGSGASPVMRMAEAIALSHHERWDGAGYPHGLRGDEIPLAARIVAAADVFDALSSDRPYRAAWQPDVIVAELRRQRGTQFDPAVIDALLDVVAASGTPAGDGDPHLPADG
ncbi:MAG: response regulator [Gemmatimonadetes bacterium]|nr:response regulator [Gemmatimonadota bacterium]